MKHLVIGLGEVGKAIKEIFGAQGVDMPGFDSEISDIDVMHICFPYSLEFPQEIIKYKLLYQPAYIVVHSTVPIGTCEKLMVNHSPVRGKHPNLVQSIKTFTKFIGGPDADILAIEFKSFKIPAIGLPKARDMEAMKLWDTTQYGVMILLEKEIHDFCEKNDVSFDLVYRFGNYTYNDGYEEMGLPDVRRPILKHQEGKIGGHCVVENCKLLNSEIAKTILEKNEKL